MNVNNNDGSLKRDFYTVKVWKIQITGGGGDTCTKCFTNAGKSSCLFITALFS